MLITSVVWNFVEQIDRQRSLAIGWVRRGGFMLANIDRAINLKQNPPSPTRISSIGARMQDVISGEGGFMLANIARAINLKQNPPSPTRISSIRSRMQDVISGKGGF